MSLGEHLGESLGSQPCFCFALWLQKGSSLMGVCVNLAWRILGSKCPEMIQKQEVVSFVG